MFLEIDGDKIEDIVSVMTGIPVSKVEKSERKNFKFR